MSETQQASVAGDDRTAPVGVAPPEGTGTDRVQAAGGSTGDPQPGEPADAVDAGGDLADGGGAGDSGDTDSGDTDSGEADSGEEAETGAGDSPGSRRSGRGARSGGESLRRLEEEGEVAADYLEELLDIVDLDGDIDIDVENGRASVAIVAESGGGRELRRLVGAQGEVLEALQDLSRLAVQARTGDRSRLMLDVGGFRAARRRTLEDLAARTCEQVRRTGDAARMEPMTAFERKVVHDVVADAGLVSESEGEEPDRRVVVHPAAT